MAFQLKEIINLHFLTHFLQYVRHFKAHFSRRHNNALSVRDVFQRDWLCSSPILRGHGAPTPVRKKHCKL